MTNKRTHIKQIETALTKPTGLRVASLAFDFDGTLIDISKPYSIAFNETLKNFGFLTTDPIELYQSGASDLRAQFNQVLFVAKTDSGLIEKCLKMHCEIYLQIHLKYLKKFGNALRAVKELHHRGFRLALIGGRPISQVEPELEFLGIRDCFDTVLTSEMVNHPKPAPDIVQRAAEIWNISPDQILVVGDSPDDIASAKRAGAFSAGVCSGYFSREVIINAKPNFLLDSASDVLDIVAPCPCKF
jgi:phosphoglycolate phosphatase-like HAD superfamily hydrolase